MDWISVQDRLPENDDEVLIFMSKLGDYRDGASAFYLASHCGYWNLSSDDPKIDAEKNPDYWFVTHWMPLPEPPK